MAKVIKMKNKVDSQIMAVFEMSNKIGDTLNEYKERGLTDVTMLSCLAMYIAKNQDKLTDVELEVVLNMLCKKYDN